MIDPRDFGARGDGQHDDTRALQQAIDSIGEAGGTVCLRDGRFLSGSLELRSGLCLRIEAGAVLQGSPRSEAYRAFQSPIISRMDAQPWRAFLYAERCTGISLCGGGVIDCGGESKELWDDVENSPFRPYGLHFVGCQNVRVQDLELRSSAFWLQRYFSCDGVQLSNLRVWNHANRNNDGVDIDSSRNVLISNCLVDASDDGICLKSEGEACCENVTITGCIIGSHATAIKLGTGSVGGFRNITITGCVIRRSQSTVMKHPSKVWGGLSGIDLLAVDGGALENVCVSNISIENVLAPIFVRLGSRNSGNVKRQGYGGGKWDGQQGAQGEGGAQVRADNRMVGVRLSNIVARNVGPIASVITGFDGHPVRDISLRDISIHCGTPATVAEAAVEPNWDPAGYPGIRGFGANMPACGLYLRDAADVHIDNLRVYPAKGDPRPAVIADRVDDLQQRDIVCNGAGEPLRRV